MKRIVIIGGGASGLVASIFAKRENNEVIILEKNDVCGKKILATGNGRCNYFNQDQSIDNYYSTTNKYVKDVINQENLNRVLNFFDNIGIVSKIKNGYYYPLSNQASSIRNALVLKAKSLGVEFKYNFLVTDILKENEQFIIYSGNEKILADKVIVSTGSKASYKDNVYDNFYEILKKLNHNVVRVLPSLVQLKGEGDYFKNWNGIRSDVVIRLYEDGQFIKMEQGEIQLTDYGISGICTFNISGYVSRGLANNKKEVVYIDFLPSFEIDEYLREHFQKRESLFPNRCILDFFEGLINNKLIKVILKVSNIKEDIKYNELSKDDVDRLIKNLKYFELDIIGTNSFDKAQVCTGGVTLEDINLQTMESKKVKNLYITGELLDIDGVCGGYNLTVAWISGILAGSDVNDKN